MKKFILFISIILLLDISNVYCIEDAEITTYYLQLGVFENSSNANKMLNKAKLYVEHAYIEVKGLNSYVIVGPYKYKNDANKDKDKLTKLGFIGIHIKSNTIPNKNNVAVISNKDLAKNILFENDVKLNGFFGQYVFFFSISENWIINNNSYIELVIDTSTISEFDYNSLTVLLNDYPLKSTWLRNEEDGLEVLRLSLPKDLINAGFNSIQIKTYYRLTENICEDERNPANWVTINKKSYIHIEYSNVPDNVGLNNFPYPYVKPLLDLPLNSEILMMKDYEEGELKGMIDFSTYVGSIIPFKNINTSIKFYNNKKVYGNNVIIFARQDNIPDKLKFLIKNENLERLNNEAFIAEGKSPWNNEKNVLLILLNNQETALALIKLISNNSILGQIDDYKQWVSAELFEEEREEEVSDYITFESLGYDSINLSGSRFASSNYNFNIPKDWEVGKEAKLLVKFRYSDILDFETSSLTVYINGVPIGSKMFSEESQIDDYLVIPIPDEVRNDNFYNIEFVANLNVKEKEDCKALTLNNNLWSFISNKSSLYLPHTIKEQYHLDNYTAPFIINNKYDDTKVIVQREPDENILSLLSSSFSYLGHNIEKFDGLSVGFEGTKKAKNNIYIGVASLNKDIQNLNSKLYVKFNKDFSKILSSKDLVLLPDFSENATSIQIIDDNDGKSLVVSATNSNSLKVASYYLSDYSFIPRLVGNAAVIGRNGNIITNYFGKKPNIKDDTEIEEKSLKQVKEKLGKNDMKRFIYFIVGMIVILVISIIFLYNRKNKQ
jgi:hypothetical protein